jgi:serine protease Do
VTRDGPAFKGGLKAGDVIMAIAGQPTPSLQVLRSIITTIQPGATVQVRAVRDGKPEEFNVTLAEFPAETQAQVSSTAALFSLTRYGLSFSDRRRGVSLDDPPTLSRVMAESAAESAGFEAGDKIVQVAGVSVETIGDVCREAAGHGLLIGSRVPMLVIKGDEQGGSTAPRTIEVQVLR